LVLIKSSEIIEEILLPASKESFQPPQRMASDGSFVVLSSMEDLHSLCERC
jgi:hypothetical protein